MNIQENVSLRDHSTMRLGGTTRYLVEVTTRMEVSEAVQWAVSQNIPVMMIGDGSNIVWKDEGFTGLVIVNKIMRYEDFAEDESNHYITVGAGENWDHVVERTVSAGLTGIECLSLIPGTAGATPVQNVGAYGQEISNSLVSVEAYDAQTKQVLNIPGSECQFSYRDSRFKSADRGRYFITALTLHLTVGSPEPPFYSSLQTMLDEDKITNPSAQQVRDSVIAIRSRKLPDPAKVANNGSFFANPIIGALDFFELSEKVEGPIPHWEVSDGSVKLSAAWLIEQSGFKDAHDPETGVATWPTQPLVLVNEKAKSTADLVKFRDRIVTTVQEKFGVSLVQEPELLP